ncbi:putative MccF-like protein (microcin C7 resistance) [Desulfocapsa sulfexigens DSM 10523]|uniref:Putative MccF-like protein (Microcin C7 resistance) n=1 Tax=Desulfocapsa sulfexigens (strain DSM 10523 / SB164P1) TaxID=1167006 RepID=M1PCM7_DESSD|nr:LD-carboxypeptidase [Desulfocapsa sulfexigens]AGF79367.1 putative MccF-like protein (microcin C7 resistance) [Desulfocapsa sulfexigens DSM 10523]
MTYNSRLPAPLQPGDCIGIIAPAGQIHDTKPLEQGMAILQNMGFELRLPRNLWPGKGYLADSDANRALEFHRMWSDPEISALLALRGGFGSLRLLPFLNPEDIKKERKLLIGFSDITILHSAIHQTNDLITLHGPMLTTLSSISSDSLQHFYACLSGNWDKPLQNHQIEVLRDGPPVRGKLIGGNLSSLISILATAIDQDWSKKIVFLEDVGEPLYRLDRMFTQLWHSGKINQPAGIILGDFSINQEQDSLEKIRFHEEIWKRVLELTEAAGMPVWGNFPIGHGRNNLTMPHGADALMDSNAVRLSYPHRP